MFAKLRLRSNSSEKSLNLDLQHESDDLVCNAKFAGPSQPPGLNSAPDPEAHHNKDDADSNGNGIDVVNLCDRCRHLPITSDFFELALLECTTLWSGSPKRYKHVCDIIDIFPTRCKLCRLFEKTASTYGLQGNNFKLVARLDAVMSGGVECQSVILMLCHFDHREFEKHVGWLSVMSAELTGCLTGRQLNENIVDWQQAKGWLHECTHRHRTTCASNIIHMRDMPFFRLIDCRSRSIVEGQPRCSYAAFSYVWGASQQHSTTSETLDLLHPPIAIEDAITCTLRLGLEFLWIDRYCIEQDDPIVKHTLIQRMDEIYRGASVTIVHAAGAGSDCGLPGLTASRCQQETVDVNGISLNIMPDAKQDIAKSRWSSRGWTYQEGLLSTRRLVFTKSQVYYQCMGMYACESLGKTLDIHGSDHWAIASRFHHSAATAFQGFPHLTPNTSKLSDRINEYIMRTLSYKSDALNAISGVLRHAWFQKPPVYSFYGLPFPHSSSSNDLEVNFTIALFWKPLLGPLHTQKHKRRNEFPSWSWAGWEGLSNIVQDGCYLNESNAYPKFIDLAGRIVGIKEYISRMNTFWDINLFRPGLVVTGLMTRVQIVPYNERWSGKVKLRTGDQVEFATGDFMSYTPLSGTPNYSDFVETTWQVIFFRASVSNRWVPRGFILKELDDGTYERLGRVCGSSRTWLKLVNEGGTYHMRTGYGSSHNISDTIHKSAGNIRKAFTLEERTIQLV